MSSCPLPEQRSSVQLGLLVWPKHTQRGLWAGTQRVVCPWQQKALVEYIPLLDSL